MTPNFIVKDPASVEPYGVDWSVWLAELGTTGSPPEEAIIDESTYRVSGKDAALTLTDASIVTGSVSTQVRLNGGTVGVRYKVTNRIVASTGDADEFSFTVLVQNK